MSPMRALRRHGRARRGIQMLWALLFVTLIGLPAIFGLHAIATATSAHSRVSETAQAAAYAAASVARPGPGAGTIVIPDEEAKRIAAAVVAQNLNGNFGIRHQDVQVEVQIHNLTFGIDQNRSLVDPTSTGCAAQPGVADNVRVAWRDDFGECHFASGVSVRITAPTRPCLWSGSDGEGLAAIKTCPDVRLVGVGFADYTYQSGNR